MIGDFKLFIQGLEVPISESLSINFGVNSPAVLTFVIPARQYDPVLVESLPRSIVSLFFSFDKKDYYLLFEGEIVSCGYNLTPLGRGLFFQAVDFTNYFNNMRLHFVDILYPVLGEFPTQTDQIIRSSEFWIFPKVMAEMFTNLDKKEILIKFIDWVLNKDVPYYANRLRGLRMREKVIDFISERAIKLFEQAKTISQLHMILQQNFPMQGDMTLIQALISCLSFFFGEYVSGFPKAVKDRFIYWFTKPFEKFLPVPISNILLPEFWSISSFRMTQNMLVPTRAYVNITTELYKEFAETQTEEKEKEKGRRVERQSMLLPKELDEELKKIKQSKQKTTGDVAQKQIDYYLTDEEKLIGIIPKYYERTSNVLLAKINKELAMELLRIEFEYERTIRNFEVICDFYPFLIPSFPMAFVFDNVIYLGKIDNIIHQIAFAGTARTIIRGNYLLIGTQEISSYKASFNIPNQELNDKLDIPFITLDENDTDKLKEKLITNSMDFQIQSKRFFISLPDYAKFYNLDIEANPIIPDFLYLKTNDKNSLFYNADAIKALLELYVIKHIV